MFASIVQFNNGLHALVGAGDANSGGSRGAARSPWPRDSIAFQPTWDLMEVTYLPLVSLAERGLSPQVGAPPKSDLMAAMMREHCKLADGFGASDALFTTSNYGGNRSSPRGKWLHVFDPDKAPDLPAGLGNNGSDLGKREKKPRQHYHDNMLLLLRQSFVTIGWE